MDKEKKIETKIKLKQNFSRRRLPPWIKGYHILVTFSNMMGIIQTLRNAVFGENLPLPPPL